MRDFEASLQGVRIAVPESRQLNTLVQLLERRGASVFQIPLVAIYDAPDPVPVLEWMHRFISAPPALFVVFTGEGMKRLLSLAERHVLKSEFISTLQATEILSRGPKPERVLREIGLKSTHTAKAPTTDGVILTLERMDLTDKSVAVQLYGEEPNQKLMTFLANKQARVDSVAPYIYADDSKTSRVVSFIQQLGNHEIDIITFTSQPQFRRLKQVAKKHGLETELQTGMNKCCIAAVGPVVRDQLVSEGYEVSIMPDRAFFMKPLVTEIMRYFEKA